jgi:hypothetical protein
MRWQDVPGLTCCRGLLTVNSSFYGADLAVKKSASKMLINPWTRIVIYAPKVTVVPPSVHIYPCWCDSNTKPAIIYHDAKMAWCHDDMTSQCNLKSWCCDLWGCDVLMSSCHDIIAQCTMHLHKDMSKYCIQNYDGKTYYYELWHRYIS